MVDDWATRSEFAFQPISNRLAVLTVHGTKAHLLAIYAPTKKSPDEVKDDFYDPLQRILDLVLSTKLTNIMHIATNCDGWEETMGKFGIGKINDKGLLSFASTNNFVVGNSILQHPRRHQLIWRNPAGDDSPILNYFLINRRFQSSLKDVRLIRGPDCRLRPLPRPC